MVAAELSAFFLRIALGVAIIGSHLSGIQAPAASGTPDFYLVAEPTPVISCTAPVCKYRPHSVTLAVKNRGSWPPWLSADASFKSGQYHWRGQLKWSDYYQALEATIPLAPPARGTEQVRAQAVVSWGAAGSQSTKLSVEFAVVGRAPRRGQNPLPASPPPAPILSTTPGEISPRTVHTGEVITVHVTPHDPSGPHAAVLVYRWLSHQHTRPMSWVVSCECYVAQLRIPPQGTAAPSLLHVTAVALITKPVNWRVTTSFTVRSRR